jgi:hypothetical protein
MRKSFYRIATEGISEPAPRTPSWRRSMLGGDSNLTSS